MPFQSEKQRRYMHANLPDIAKRWERDYAGGGRIGFGSGTNGITLGSDKYNITFEPGASGSLSSRDLGEGYKIDQKNISYGVDTTANLGPIGIGIDYKKYLDKYDVTKDDVTVEKDTERDRQIAYMLDLDLDTLYAKIDSDRDFKNFYLTLRYEFNQGGVVPAHEAGIYGLAEGGQLVKPGPGRQGYNGWESEFSTDWGGEAEPQGSPPGTDPGPGIVTESGGDASIAEQIAAQDRQRKQDRSDIITRGEAEKTEEWEKSEEAPWNKKTNWLKTLGTLAAVYTGVAPILGIQTPTVVKFAADANTLYKNIDRSVKLGQKFNIIPKDFSTDEYLASIKNNALEYQKKKRVYDSLPDGHPEKIALSVELEIGKKPEHLGAGGDDVSIKYTSEEITDTNDAKAELASSRWRQEQKKVDRSKQMAFWQMMMTPHMGGATPKLLSAQGGRVPQGYNTGGLSNLFKLKNV
jgi:hypothetical protein